MEWFRCWVPPNIGNAETPASTRSNSAVEIQIPPKFKLPGAKAAEQGRKRCPSHSYPLMRNERSKSHGELRYLSRHGNGSDTENWGESLKY